jgi:hypothetical protein
MHQSFKNALSILLISTAIAACGDPVRTTTIREGGSVLDNPISQAAKQAVTEATSAVQIPNSASKEEAEELIKNTVSKRLDTLEDLYHKSTNESEKRYLSIWIEQVKAGQLRSDLSDISRDELARKSAFDFSNATAQFFAYYLQNKELRSYLDTYARVQTDILLAEMNRKNSSSRATIEEYTLKINALQSDAVKIQKKILEMYQDPKLSDYSRKEMEELKSLGLMPVELSPTPSAETPNLSESVSLRRARQGGASADFSQLRANGISGGATPLSLPMYVQLKGDIEGSKTTKGMTGLAVYKLNNTLVGMIHGYANASNNPHTSLSHNESSLVISQSFGQAYLEGQAGFIRSTTNQQEVSGQRYQLSAGYDFEHVTPFVQASARDIHNLNERSIQVGCEVEIMRLTTDQYTLSSHMMLKGGYHSLRGSIGSIEGAFELGLHNGVNMQAGFTTFNNATSTIQINISVDQ